MVSLACSGSGQALLAGLVPEMFLNPAFHCRIKAFALPFEGWAVTCLVGYVVSFQKLFGDTVMQMSAFKDCGAVRYPDLVQQPPPARIELQRGLKVIVFAVDLP